jgi:hypothetical protein
MSAHAAVAHMARRGGGAYLMVALPDAHDISRAAEAPGAPIPLAGVAELVDARDLGSRDASRGGSSPSARTKSHPRLLGMQEASHMRRGRQE